MSDRRPSIVTRALSALGLGRQPPGYLETRGGPYALNDPVLAALFEGASVEGRARGLSAVEACVSLISGALASCPAVVTRPDAAGVPVPAPDHPVSRLLREPSSEHNAFELVERMAADVALEGNAYALVTRDGRGVPVELTYIPAGNASVERLPASPAPNLRYRMTLPATGEHVTVGPDSVLHIRYRLSPTDPARGLSVPQLGQRSLGVAEAVEVHAKNLFDQGARPGGALAVPGKLREETREKLKRQLIEFVGGKRTGSVVVLEDGVTYTPIGITARDAQLTEISEALVLSVARLFQVPAPLLTGGAGMNYSAVQSLITAWAKTGLAAWVNRWEAALTAQLLSSDARAGGLRVELDTAGLLRLEDEARGRFYSSAIAGGWLTPNEVRAREGLGPKPGGDDLRAVPGSAPADPGGRPAGSRSIESGDPTPGPNSEGNGNG